jgi:hypothetical protein
MRDLCHRDKGTVFFAQSAAIKIDGRWRPSEEILMTPLLLADRLLPSRGASRLEQNYGPMRVAAFAFFHWKGRKGVGSFAAA